MELALEPPIHSDYQIGETLDVDLEDSSVTTHNGQYLILRSTTGEMSGNSANPDNETASRVVVKLGAIGRYVKEKLSNGEQYMKIFSAEYEGFFENMRITVRLLQEGGKHIDWLNVMEPLARYEKSIYIIIQLVLTVHQMRKVMGMDLKSHKERIERITRSLEDIETKTMKYAKEVEELGNEWRAFLDNDAEQEKRLKSFDFTFDQLFIKMKGCASTLLIVKQQIHKGKEDVHEYQYQHDVAMGDVRKLGLGAVGFGGTMLSSSGEEENTSDSDDDEAGDSRKGTSWLEIIGGVVAVAGVIAIAFSYINSWITSNTTAKIQKEYDALNFEADKLKQILTELTEAMENYKEHRSRYPN